MGWWPAIAVAIGLVCSSEALAKKPDKPPGGGGEPTYEKRVLIEGEGAATDIQQQDGVVEIVGLSFAEGSGVYWLLNAAGETVMSVDLACPEGHLNGASALNRDGAIVGWQSTAGVDNSGRPVIWRGFATDPLQLPVPDGFVGNASASDVNDNLLVVGNLMSNDGERSIVAWQVTDQEGVLIATDAIEVATGTQMGAAKLNNQGFVTATLDNHAFRWQVVWNPDLGEIGGLEVASQEQLFDAFSYAADINEAGTVCGSVTVFGGGHEAYAMTLDGSLLELPLLKVSRNREAVNEMAYAINDSGQVVGIAEVIKGVTILKRPAVLWNVGESAVELPLSTWSAGVNALDDAGWAVGFERVSGISVPILLRPTR
jgi:uncharacterized membrane protein